MLLGYLMGMACRGIQISFSIYNLILYNCICIYFSCGSILYGYHTSSYPSFYVIFIYECVYAKSPELHYKYVCVCVGVLWVSWEYIRIRFAMRLGILLNNQQRENMMVHHITFLFSVEKSWYHEICINYNIESFLCYNFNTIKNI